MNSKTKMVVYAALVVGLFGLGCQTAPDGRADGAATVSEDGADSGVAAPFDPGLSVDAGFSRDSGLAVDAGTTADLPDAAVVETHAGAPRCGATSVRCADESIAVLKLFDKDDAGLPVVNNTSIVSEGSNETQFTSRIDARAGGAAVKTSAVYARFTPTGLTKVPLSDVEALDSTNWDIAFRRYVIRINSGVSGPSCTLAARLAAGTEFESVNTAPANLQFASENYFSDACEVVADSSGIGAPNTALSGFWTYSACVQMTGAVFILQLQNGRYVKLQVLEYYDAAPQVECNNTGMVPTPSGAGNIKIRWAFIAPPK